MLVLFFFFILRTSNLLDQTDLAQGTVPRSKIGLALTSNCTLSRNGPWVQMDRNSSGSVFSWPDAGGSRPEAMGLHERGPSLARGAEPPALKTRGGSWLPSIHPRLSQQGRVPTSGWGMSAWRGCFWHRQEGHARCRLSLMHFYTSFFLFIWISCNFTCKHLATKWIVIYSELLAMPSNRGNPPKKKKSAEFVGSLVASATWPHLGRSWLTPLSPCLDDRDEQGSWETPNSVWSKVSLK